MVKGRGWGRGAMLGFPKEAVGQTGETGETEERIRRGGGGEGSAEEEGTHTADRAHQPASVTSCYKGVGRVLLPPLLPLAASHVCGRAVHLGATQPSYPVEGCVGTGKRRLFMPFNQGITPLPLPRLFLSLLLSPLLSPLLSEIVWVTHTNGDMVSVTSTTPLVPLV